MTWARSGPPSLQHPSAGSSTSILGTPVIAPTPTEVGSAPAGVRLGEEDQRIVNAPHWRTATAEDAAALRDLERIASQHRARPRLRRPALPRRRRARAVGAAARRPGGDGRGGRGRPTGWSPSPPTTATRCGTSAVRPDHWSAGLGREGIRARGGRRSATSLWVLEANHRARRLYESLGWAPSGAGPGVPVAALPDRGRVRRSLGSSMPDARPAAGDRRRALRPARSRTSRLPATRWSRSTRPTRPSPPRSRGCARRPSRRGWSTCWCVATPSRSTRCWPSARRCARRRTTSTPPSCGSSPSSAAS